MTGAADLHARLSAELRAFFARRGVDAHAADDLVQETLLRALVALPALREAERADALVRRIARNALVDRRRAAHTPAALESDPAAASDLGDGCETAREVAAWLPDFVAELPEPYREAVRLADLEGVPQDELALRLDLSPSGARSRVQRGRARVRALLLQCCEVERDRRGGIVEWRRREGECCDD